MPMPADIPRFVNPYPKARFLASNDNVNKHRDMVDSRTFERACDFALLQYQAELCERESNPTVIGLKIAGAQEFVKLFRLLSEDVKVKPTPRPNDNLEPA